MFDFGNKKAELTQQLVEAEQKNAEQQAMLQAISRAMAVIEFTPEGNIITANDNFLATVGYSLSEIQNKHHKLFCRVEYVNSGEYQQFWRTLNQGKPMTGQFERQAKGGKIIWLEASYTPVFDQFQQLVKIVKVATDISEQVRNNQQHQSMLNAIEHSMAVIEFDLKGNILHANDNFLNTTHYSLQEIQGRHHKMFCEDSLVNSTEYTQFWQELNRGQYQSGQYKRVDKHGHVIWLEASYNPIFDELGNLTKIIKFATNITDRVEGAAQAREVASHTSNEADHAAQKGMEIVQDTVTLMANLSQDIGTASQNLQELNTQADQINNIVNTISGIAEQTNLLALNAAIEAARAGEQGRGFAVVADEVRQLAARTSSSTTEIAEVVNKNVELSDQATHSMQKSTSQIEEGSALVEKLNVTIADINSGVKAIGETIEKLN